MGNLDIKAINGRWNPDFFGEKADSRKAIEQNPRVRSLIDSKLLLTKDLNQFMYESLALSTSIRGLIESLAETSPVLLTEEIRGISRKASLYLRSKGKITYNQEIVTEAISKARNEILKDKRLETKESILSTTTNLEDMQDNFRKNHSGALKIDILRGIRMYLCKKCGYLVCKDSFRSKSCNCGTTISSSSDTYREEAMVLEEKVETFIKSNIWLEYGVELLFSRARYESSCGVFILGASGVRHEIDLLAANKALNKRAIAECKNTDITIDYIFKLSGQMSDIGCSSGYLFSTGICQSPEVKKLAIAKNIHVFEKILEQDPDSVVTRLSS